ncbi:XCP1 [Symbiodinium natans]|uniref:XCP1 protein n=1 Tax=Symbiodinium natans TaxID=878477 RepID=A0A812K649_9DINO|nr:XCP1 [Symbiodinium natans]
MELPERSPWGPWAEFGRGICGAEEAVAATIDQILTDGGTLLWQKYLERKAFSFASNAISDALVSRLRMCYVSHDAGELAEDGALRGPEWNIEEAPGR